MFIALKIVFQNTRLQLEYLLLKSTFLELKTLLENPQLHYRHFSKPHDHGHWKKSD